jgi:guanine deaminase
MDTNSFVLRGDICYSLSPTVFALYPHGLAVCIGGRSAGVYDANELPERYAAFPVVDYGCQLIVPGLNDIHVHAPQYGFRGMAMDLELLDWLNAYTFPEEKKYLDLSYADRGYTIFAEDLQHSFTTRAIIFATMHVPATELLMDKLEATGLKTYVGKVNMDRNSPDYLSETDAAASLSATREWLSDVKAKHYANTSPILTPRFTPTCSDELLQGLGEIKAQFNLPVQSHLSENPSEIDWVRDLCPWADCYGRTYEHFNLLGEQTIMAHCNYSTDEEIEILKKTGTYVAHCPQSNAFLASGIAPMRRYMQKGLNVRLGTDVAGGASINMFRAVSDAVACSKLRWRCVDQSLAPLTIQEAFYLATLGGGSFFGKVGSLAKGYEFDALVLDDSGIRSPRELTVAQRLERFCYLSNEGGKLTAKYVAGKKIQL